MIFTEMVEAMLQQRTELLYFALGISSFVLGLKLLGWIFDRQARSEQCPVCGFRTYPNCIKVHMKIHNKQFMKQYPELVQVGGHKL